MNGLFLEPIWVKVSQVRLEKKNSILLAKKDIYLKEAVTEDGGHVIYEHAQQHTSDTSDFFVAAIFLLSVLACGGQRN